MTDRPLEVGDRVWFSYRGGACGIGRTTATIEHIDDDGWAYLVKEGYHYITKRQLVHQIGNLKRAGRPRKKKNNG